MPVQAAPFFPCRDPVPHIDHAPVHVELDINDPLGVVVLALVDAQVGGGAELFDVCQVLPRAGHCRLAEVEHAFLVVS